MESVFDVATPDELIRILGSEESVDFERALERSADDEHALLALLYGGRGDDAGARRHLDKIQDAQLRMDHALTLFELSE